MGGTVVTSARRNLRQGGGRRCIISYGGPDDHTGEVIFTDGYLRGMTVVLEKALTSGTVEFFFKVNNVDVSTSTQVVRMSAADGLRKVLSLTVPIPVASGDLVSVGVRESRFPGEVVGVAEEDVLPARNAAGIVLMMEQQ